MKRMFCAAIALLTAAMLLCLSACAKPQNSQAATADEAIHAVEESDNVNGMRFDMTLLQFSQEGIIIRIAAESIRLCARPSKGVTVMKVGEGDKVVTLARSPHVADDDAEAEEVTEEASQT